MSKIIRALDVVSNLRSLADSFEGLVAALEANETAPALSREVEIKDVEPESKQPNSKQPTLEKVRAAMAEKNRDGHREGVKVIIRKYGADKLTALDPKHYGAVFKEVGDLK